MTNWLRQKHIIQSADENTKLKPSLGWPHLVAMGIGGVVGTGIYTLIGVGAGMAGPAVLLAFVIAGVISACAALAYAELATMIPVSGGAYTYTYATLGEFLAWVVGWSLILEYSLVVGTVAIGWSGYTVGFLNDLGIHLPFWLTAGYTSIDPVTGVHGLVNLPAVLIVFVVAGLLLLGTRESATVNSVLVVVKIVALLIFVAVALPHFNPDNLKPFMPNGFFKSTVEVGGKWVEHGVMVAAAIIFFAFYGFDTIATAAEEAKNPARDVSIGIVGSLFGCIVIYILVGLAGVGAVHYTQFAESSKPLSFILEILQYKMVAGIVSAAAVVALPTVLLAFFYGQTRIFFVMGRDGLLPRALAKVHKKKGIPVATTIFTAIIIAVLAGTVKLGDVASLANAGTLVAFTSVGLCLLVLRWRQPDRPRKFRTPFAPLVGSVAVLGCLYLFWNLKSETHIWFTIWTVIGILVYFSYARRNSAMNKKRG